jgi:hypothetical protein
MAFPEDLSNVVDYETEVLAAHINDLEAKVGINSSAVTDSLDYQLNNPASVDPGHSHTNFLNDLGINVASPTKPLDIDGDTIRLRNNRTISAANDTGTKGEICWDDYYIYVCIATNTWRRASLAWWGGG